MTDSENDENDIILNGKLFGKCIAFGVFEKKWLFNEVLQGLKDFLESISGDYKSIKILRLYSPKLNESKKIY